MKPDLNKFEDVDIFISGDTTPEETKAFSEFLKAYKAKEARSKKARQIHLHDGVPARKKARADGK
jgi:hypothetical protein